MDNKKIGEFIVEKRKAKNLTQQELADKLCVTVQAISKWECGKGIPDSSLMLNLASELGISVTELLCGETVPAGDTVARAEENAVELVKRIEDARFTKMSDGERKALEREFKDSTSARFWKMLNILTIFQSGFWIAMFIAATFLNWHPIAVTVLLVMMVLNATVPIIITIVRLSMFSMWLNLVKNIKD